MPNITVSNSQQTFIAEIKRLYASGLSVNELSTQMGVSAHKIWYWMEKANIKSRGLSEALYCKYNKLGDPFSIKEIKTIEEAKLFGLGLGIYWGEGSKLTPNSLRVANSDPRIILTFVRFLIEICRVKPTKIKYSLICFNDSQVETVAEHWATVLGTSRQQFGKITQIPSQGKGTYKRKSQFGVCTVRVHNTKLRRWLIERISELK